jgi:hypothetical protein
MLVALGTIGAKQSKAAATTAHAVVKLLNYTTEHPDATIQYNASDMVLYLHSNASYLSATKACSRAGGHFLSGNPLDFSKHQENNLLAMAQSTPHANSCTTSSPLQPKPKLVLYF